MNKLEKKVRALVEKDSFNDTCLNCAFYPGGGSWMCLAPWSDGQMEDEAIEPCYEGVYRYLSGKPGPHLQKLVDKGVDYLWLREKGQFAARNPAAQKEAARSATNTTDGKGGTDLVGPVSASHDTREQEDLQA